jgi:hypothetical protein
MLTVERISTIIGRIQKVYFCILCLGAIGLVGSVIAAKYSLAQHLQVANLLIVFLIYFGLRRKKHWVVILILISSPCVLLGTLLLFFQPPIDFIGLVVKCVELMIILFCGYQINFFSKREVRKLYGVKGTIIF